MSGRTVYLFVTQELLNTIGRASGVDYRDFLEAMKKGPPWAAREGLCQRAIETLEGWRGRGLHWPPYVGYLALFVLAAGVEGEFEPNAYYARLRYLLGEPHGYTLPGFPHMLRLWEDLEKWSNLDQGGSLGLFAVRIVGGWRHVGLPKGQTLLTEHERGALPAIFGDAQLDPTAPPSDTQFVSLIGRMGAGKLRPRTLGTLASVSGEDAELRRLLIEQLLQELRDWDGTVPAETQTAQERPERVLGYLRLSGQVDPIARRAAIAVRCTFNREFPEDGLTVAGQNDQAEFHCEEELSGVSTTLVDVRGGRELDAASLDWRNGADLFVRDRGWRVRLPASSVRIFMSGELQGLPGIIEVRKIRRNTPFYLAVTDEHSALIEPWGATSCQSFRNLQIQSGLPSGWRLYQADRALDDTGVRERFPELSFSVGVQVQLERGIRIGTGNIFFWFAPPVVIVDGGDGTEEVMCDGQPMLWDVATGEHHLTEQQAKIGWHHVEVARNGHPITRLSLHLNSASAPGSPDRTDLFDKFGQRIERAGGADAGISGAFPLRLPVPDAAAEMVIPLYGATRIIYLGRRVGEIVDWPREAIPVNWSPVWAVAMHRRGAAYFCGDSLAENSPLTARDTHWRDVRRWKAILWHGRKRIRPPNRPGARALWQKFVAVARDV